MDSFDFGVNLAFWLTILSTLLCIVYGVINWNKDNEELKPELVTWAKEEDKIEEDL